MGIYRSSICVYAKYKDEYLNYYDMYRLKEQGKFYEIGIVVSENKLSSFNTTKKEFIKQYKDFIINYFGCIGVNSVYLHLDRDSQFLTFQGVDTNNISFTHKVEDLYYSLNNTLVLFEYKEKIDLGKEIKAHKVETQQDYLKLMGSFNLQPKYKLHLQNNMNWFSHYEIRIDDNDWVKVEGEDYDWDLIDGINTLNVRAVNDAGVRGVVTTIKIEYGIAEN